jgi:hypothetical protein
MYSENAHPKKGSGIVFLGVPACIFAADFSRYFWFQRSRSPGESKEESDMRQF